MVIPVARYSHLHRLVLTLGWLAPGCVSGPPMSPGLVDMRTASPGHTTVSVVGGAGGIVSEPADGRGGGGLSVDPYLTKRLSLPMAAGAGRGFDSDLFGDQVTAATRVGARYRLSEHLALGGGFDTGHWISPDGASLSGLGPDAEISWGTRYGLLTLSSTFRPTVLVRLGDGDPDLYLHANFAAGVDLGAHLRFTSELWGGMLSTWSNQNVASSGFLAGIVGLSYSFGDFLAE